MREIVECSGDVWIELGVTLDLDQETSKGLRKVIRFWRKLSTDVHITSGSEGTTHPPHSYHHFRRAFDLRRPEWFNEEVRQQLIKELGQEWLVLDEETHLHFQCSWLD